MGNGVQVCIGVVSPSPLRLQGLAAILEQIHGAHVLALELDAATYEDGLDLLLLDLCVDADTVLYAIRRVLSERPQSRILVAGEAATEEEVQAILAAGAKGFLPESLSEAEIRTAAQVVLDGSIWGPRKVLARLIEEKRAAEAASPQVEPMEGVLSRRECEVLHLLKRGQSNRQIASALGVEEGTVKAHVSRMMRKTSAISRLELTLRAITEG